MDVLLHEPGQRYGDTLSRFDGMAINRTANCGKLQALITVTVVERDLVVVCPTQHASGGKVGEHWKPARVNVSRATLRDTRHFFITAGDEAGITQTDPRSVAHALVGWSHGRHALADRHIETRDRFRWHLIGPYRNDVHTWFEPVGIEDRHAGIRTRRHNSSTGHGLLRALYRLDQEVRCSAWAWPSCAVTKARQS